MLIAEIGGNHEGDFAAAVRLCDLAIDCGADVVKFQLYTGDSLVSALEAPDRHRHFQRFELSQEQHIALAQRCQAAGRRYLASVWDLDMLAWIDPFLPFYKVGSGDLTAYPLLSGFAERGKPIVLSTGLATYAEVLASVQFLRQVDARYGDPEYLALLQCTSLYPTPESEVNLRVMDQFRATGLTVGYSDHTLDAFTLFVAAARGAQILEFHFTDQPHGRSFRDHQLSLTAADVQQLCAQLQRLACVLGDGEKRATPGELASGHVTSFRRAVYSRRELTAGEPLRAEDLICLRPAHGIDARLFEHVIGQRVAVDTPAYAALQLLDPVRHES